jgi:hypothetical protein
MILFFGSLQSGFGAVREPPQILTGTMIVNREYAAFLQNAAYSRLMVARFNNLYELLFPGFHPGMVYGAPLGRENHWDLGSQGFTLGWYAAPRWGAKTICLFASPPIFIQTTPSIRGRPAL